MSQPALHELQTLLHRLTQSKPLTQTDIALLDHSSNHLYSSEMANLYNQITLFLSESPQMRFLEFLNLVVTYSSNPQTKLLAFSLLMRKVAKNWIAFEECNRIAIKAFVVQTIEGNIDEQGDSRALHVMNQILVSIFRFQPKELFQDFAASLIEHRETTATRKLINNLSIVRLIFEEAHSQNQISYPETYEAFRYEIEKIMVSFLTFFRFCLQRGSQSSVPMLKKTLQIIKLSIEYIPCFDLFNCDIIEFLVGMMESPQYHQQLSSCFEQIIKFKQRNETNDNHSKIMKKLIFVLQSHLQKFTNFSRLPSLQQKDSPSTESSFKSKSTKKPSQRHSILGKDILTLLYQFLNKYIPFMDDTKSKQNYEIISQVDIKIYFSPQLYDSLKVTYRQMTHFIEIILEELDPLHIEHITYDILEINRMVVSCVRNMLVLVSKLKMELDSQMKNIIKLTMVYLTPYPKDFVQCYMKYQLLQKGFSVLVSMPLLSDQLQQQYRQLIKTIIAQRSSLNLLLALFNNLSNCNQIIYEITQADRMKSNMSMMSAYQLEEYCHLKTVNQINRICWSVVYAFQAKPLSMKDLKLMNFYRTVNNSSRIKLLAPFYKCLSTNAKYVALITFPQQPLWRALVYAMQQSTLHEDVLQLIILVLTQIFSNPKAMIKITEHEIQMVIDKTRQLEAMQTFDERIMKIYPAIVNVLFRYIGTEGKSEGEMEYESEGVDEKAILVMMISEELQPMKDSLKVIDMLNSPILQKIVSLLKRLDLIGVRVIELLDGRKVGRRLLKCIHYIRSLYSQIFKDYEFKYVKFNEYLQNIPQQSFDVYHYIEFCQTYIKLQQLIIKFTLVIHQSNPKQSKNPSKQLSPQLQIIFKGSQLLRGIFTNHKIFKLKEFFTCQRELYRYLITSQIPDSLSWINNWIIEILASLHAWYEDEAVVSEKYRFIREVISLLGLRINKVNMKAVLTVFYDFYDTKLTSSHLQLIMDIVDEIVLMIKHDVYQLNKDKIDFEELIDTIKKTFEICFSNHAENQYLFDRMNIISRLRFPLCPQKKQDNITVLFLLLQAHISQVVDFQQDDDHNRQLKHIIHEHDLRRWRQQMKSYVFYVRRVTLEHTRSAQQ